MKLPESLAQESQLEELLSRPNEAAVTAMQRLAGDVIVLGAGGKMGPSLSRMVVRASRDGGVERRVIAVSRFRKPVLRRHSGSRGSRRSPEICWTTNSSPDFPGRRTSFSWPG